VHGERDPETVSAFVLGAILAGGNGVAIRFSNRELDPLWGAGLRFWLASAVLVAIFAALRLELPRGRALVGAVIFGIVQFAATYALAYYALVELHAGFGQVLLALVPLMTLLLAVAQRQERLRGGRGQRPGRSRAHCRAQRARRGRARTRAVVPAT
jgi:drug/metabolite transporter (DMT)-like permease